MGLHKLLLVTDADIQYDHLEQDYLNDEQNWCKIDVHHDEALISSHIQSPPNLLIGVPCGRGYCTKE